MISLNSNTQNIETNISEVKLSPLFESFMRAKTNNTTNPISIININTTTTDITDNDILPILPSISECDLEDIAAEHDAQPIKSISDITAISNYFISQSKYRNNMLFIMGINTGLRCSDLRVLKFSNIINPNFTFKTELVILEQKTKNTRKIQKNRHITINNAIRQAVTLYLQNNTCSLDQYIFRSESNNGSNDNKPMSRQAIQDILVGVTNKLNINIRAGTHCMRKTFSYHTITLAKDRSRALELLQKLLGHSSITTTLRYAGITDEEMKQSYNDLNLGYQEVITLTNQYVED